MTRVRSPDEPPSPASSEFAEAIRISRAAARSARCALTHYSYACAIARQGPTRLRRSGCQLGLPLPRGIPHSVLSSRRPPQIASKPIARSPRAGTLAAATTTRSPQAQAARTHHQAASRPDLPRRALASRLRARRSVSHRRHRRARPPQTCVHKCPEARVTACRCGYQKPRAHARTHFAQCGAAMPSTPDTSPRGEPDGRDTDDEQVM